MTFQNYNVYEGLTSARLVATTNQTGTYFNGPSNNGVGATFTFATGALTIDSVIVEVGDSVLLVAQTNDWENGIYVCTQAGATGVSAIFERRDDMQNIEQMRAGQYISIGAGTANGGAMFVIIEPLPQRFGIDGFFFNAAITTGLGTAAAKGASDNTEPLLASVNGATVIGNLVMTSDVSGTIQDSGVVANTVLSSAIVTPDVNANLVSFDITVGFAALALGGTVILIDSSAAKQYRLRSLQLNSGGTNFSGGGGDRDGSVSDGTTVYSVIPAATMQALVNAQWGVTGLPNPASAAIFTPTVAGADLVFVYSGGTTDYTAGSLRISGVAERIA